MGSVGDDRVVIVTGAVVGVSSILSWGNSRAAGDPGGYGSKY